jgi:hypothetical protein
MNLPVEKQKWGIGVLAVLSLILVWNLVRQYREMQPGSGHAQIVNSGGARTERLKSNTHVADDLAQYDPNVHFDALKSLDSRPLPDEDRDPFQFVGGVVAQAPQTVVPSAQVAAPAPPPPPPLKAVGYNELPGGKKEAMVTFNDDLVVVHEGETVGVKFKVLTISPSSVVVEDGDTHEKIELQFPQ